MNSDLQSNIVGKQYQIISVEKTEPPEGMPEGNWHRYVIERGGSTIQGYQLGTLKSVKAYVEGFVKELNERTVGGFSGYGPRKKSSKRS